MGRRAVDLARGCGPLVAGGSIAAGADGELVLFGTQTPIAPDGGSWWDPERGALAANDLFWSRSLDGGATWSPRTVIPMPDPGAAEAPGPMLTTRSGRRLVCYAPYPTFDPAVVVDRPRIVVVRSDDDGATWQGATMLRLHPDGGTAEAWLTELADGRLFGACWGMDLATADLPDLPNPYALSSDGGATWSPTRSTGLRGQAVGMAALPDGRVALVYNQRDAARSPVGVWLAVLAPPPTTPAWSWTYRSGPPPPAPADHRRPVGHDAWQSFTFGEPGVVRLPDGDLLVTIWSGVSGREGVVSVRVRLD